MRRCDIRNLLFATTALLPIILLLTLPLAHSFQTRETTTNLRSSVFSGQKPTSLYLNPTSVNVDLQKEILSTISSFTKKLPFSVRNKDADKDGAEFLKALGLESDPTPRKLYVQPGEFLNVASASLPFLLRAAGGIFAEGYKLSIVPKNETQYSVLSLGNYQISETSDPPGARRERLSSEGGSSNGGPIVLYELESCPACRRVREAVSILSLEVEYRPCPINGSNRRQILQKHGDGATFPLLRDPSTGVELSGPNEIVDYLFRFYGRGNAPSSLSNNALNTLTATLALLPRRQNGLHRRPSNPPRLPLVLYAYESSPFCKLVREELCGLEIAHVQISCPRGSVGNRQRLFEKTGRFQAPYLEDPNEGVGLFESRAIVEYLGRVYEVGASPVRYL